MCKDLEMSSILNMSFLQTDYTNKYLCIKEALVNDTFESIDETTELFMRYTHTSFTPPILITLLISDNNVKLLPLKSVSSHGITERLVKSKKYKTILFEDDVLNSKFTDTSYSKQYLPDLILLAVNMNQVSSPSIDYPVNLNYYNRQMR